MEIVYEEKNFKAVVWKEGEQIDLRAHRQISELLPIELHIKKDGEINDNPSYAFVLIDSKGRRYVAQITDRMLQEGLKAAGIENTKTK